MNRRRGIPTTYRHVRFRSILEARWACFFDLCGLPWSYEPFEDRVAYIPDFLVAERLLCEVRPLRWGALYDDGPLVEAQEQLKTAFTDARYDLTVLGDGPLSERHIGVDADDRDLPISWALSLPSGEHVVAVGDKALGVKPLRLLSHRTASFLDLWRIAGSRTQWRARP